MIKNIHIEISKGTSVKYEYKDGKLIVDRFLKLPFVYPFNYGYIPNTLGRDGDALDAVVICEEPILPCATIKCKLIGVLKTTDESGEDNKFIFVPDDSIDENSKNINTLSDLKQNQLEKIKYFFMHYKDNQSSKWIEVGDYEVKNINSIFNDSNVIGTNTVESYISL